MTVLNENRHTGEFIASEANGLRGRAVVTVASGSEYVAGTVMGQVTSTGKYKPLAPSATDGSETAAAILYDHADASAGDAEAVVITADTVVAGDALTFPSGITAANKTAAVTALRDQGIVVR